MDRERRISAHGSPGSDPGELTRLHARLLARMESLGPALVAVSGGVDSRLLCALASQALPLQGGFAAVHVRGCHVPQADSQRARQCCSDWGLEFFELSCEVLEIPEVRQNGRLRCYHCKRAVYERILAFAGERGYARVLDGSTVSDAAEYRPGRKALEELAGEGVVSPLAAAGLDKTQVRVLARGIGLAEPEQPARPCLLTRFAYDLQPDQELLRLLDQGEALLVRGGFREFRLRVPQQGRVVLHLAESELDLWELQREGALAALADLGLEGVDVELAREVGGWYDRQASD